VDGSGDLIRSRLAAGTAACQGIVQVYKGNGNLAKDRLFSEGSVIKDRV
jgi:hypothetical protein